VENSALSRILRHPNAYQSSSDFLLALTRSLYLEGNAYAVAIRNNRFEVDELHLMDPRQSSPQVTEDGDVFYRLSGNDVISRQIWGQDRGTWSHLLVPQRDVLHVRLNTYERTKWPWPLLGESPLIAAYGDIAWFDRIRDQQSQFFQNQARPSAVLTTDLVLDRDQVQNLRDRWNEQSKGLHAGGVPILTGGLKVHQWAESKARDMQIAEQLQLTRDQIALVFRIPLAVLGLGRTPISSTEALMGQWKSMGLGFCLNHIEEAFGILFDLRGQPYEYCEFDTEALLRTARKERIDALARAVQGGIYSPNEARAKEDLPAVKAGEEPRVQQQVVPLSFASSGEIPPAPPASSTTPPAAPIAASTSNVMIDVRSVFERARKFDLASL
jgi:HK97 family phage portal protein